MPKERDIRSHLSADDRQRLAHLEKEMDGILDRLSVCPSDTHLASRLSQIEISIVRITKERTIDY